MSPFKALYGQECLTPLKWTDPMIRVQASKDMLDEMQQQIDLIQFEIRAAQDRQKAYADSHHLERNFEEGDMVFLRVRPKKISLSLGKFKKLSARYCGPYVILNKVNDQAYELLLPPEVKVHNVFNVSLLKKYVPDDRNILGDEQILVSKDGTLDISPERILQVRERTLRNQTQREYRIKWTGYPEEDASWEREDTLDSAYPEFLSR